MIWELYKKYEITIDLGFLLFYILPKLAIEGYVLSYRLTGEQIPYDLIAEAAKGIPTHVFGIDMVFWVLFGVYLSLSIRNQLIESEIEKVNKEIEQ